MSSKNKRQVKQLNPKIVLAVAAHPDDIEYCLAGTIAKWCSGGVSVHYLILTDGSKGSGDRKISPKDLIRTRRNEQQKAASLLGVKQVIFLAYKDGELENSFALKQDITKVVRTIRPDVVVTMDPTMIYSLKQNYINHPDHRAAGQAVLDAVFPLARDHLSFPKLLKAGLEPHKVPTILLVNFEKCNYFVDVSKNINDKVAALKKHASQFPEPQFTESQVIDLAKQLGKKNNCQCAEGFIRIDIPN